MAGYLLSGSAVKKVSRVIKGQSTTPLRGGVQGSRRIGGQGGKISDHPWKMSLFKKDGDDTQYCKVLGGAIYTSDDDNWIYEYYDVPEGLVNLSNYVDGDKVEIYIRIANDWEVGGSLNTIPTLTVLTGENDTNFAGNNVRIPQSDLGYYYHHIGRIYVKAIPDTDPVELEYDIRQYEKNYISIEGLQFKGFSLFAFESAKTVDTENADTKVIFCTEGYAQTPDNYDDIPEYRFEVPFNNYQYIYLKITCDKDENTGGYVNYQKSIVTDTARPAEPTDTEFYYTIGTCPNSIYVYTVNVFEGEFLSPARIW